MFSVGLLLGVAGLLTFVAGGFMYYGRLLERLELLDADSFDRPEMDATPERSAAHDRGSVNHANGGQPQTAPTGLSLTGPENTDRGATGDSSTAVTLLEAVELTRVSPGKHLPDRLQENTLGRYASRTQAILRIEATRQQYRQSGVRRDMWFFIRDSETGRPLWYVEGLSNVPNVIDLREAPMLSETSVIHA